MMMVQGSGMKLYEDRMMIQRMKYIAKDTFIKVVLRRYAKGCGWRTSPDRLDETEMRYKMDGEERRAKRII